MWVKVFKKDKDLGQKDHRRNTRIKNLKKTLTEKTSYPFILSKHIVLTLLCLLSSFSFGQTLYGGVVPSPPQNEPVAPLTETDQEGFLPSPFYSVTKDGKTHWVFGYGHLIPSLSHFMCYRQIEQKIVESDLVLLERTQDSLKRVFFHSSTREFWERERNRFPSLGSFNELNEQTQDFFIKGTDEFSSREFSIINWYPLLDYRDYLFIASSIERVKLLKISFDYKLDKLVDDLGIPKISLDDENNLALNLSYMRDISNIMSIEIRNSNSSEEIRQLIESRVNGINNFDTFFEKYKPAAYPYQKYISDVKGIVSEDILNYFSDEAIQLLFVDRNKIWLEKFLTAHKGAQNNSLFLAAGLGHLLGPFNLLDMLREEGFSIQLMDCGLQELLPDETGAK